jgi:hypothetical protein
MISISGAKIPFSAAQRAQALPQLIAYTNLFGLPSFFLTISPSDLDQPLTIRLTTTSSDRDDVDSSQRELKFPLPTLAERGRLLAENPVAAAEVFQRIMQTVLKTMVGLLPHRLSTSGRSQTVSRPLRDREQCLLGVPVAHFHVFESQGRGTLHTHGAIWSDLPPSLLEDIAEYPHLVAIVGDAIDEICCASLPTSVHDADDARSQQRLSAKRSSLLMSPPPNYESLTDIDEQLRAIIGWIPATVPSFSTDATSLDSDSYTSRWHTTAAAVQRHTKHMATCRKGNSGKYGCRMSMPQAIHPEPTGPVELNVTYDEQGRWHVTAADTISSKVVHIETPLHALPTPDSRVLSWDIHRPTIQDTNVVTFNRALTAALGCNTALYALGNAMQCKQSLFYLLKYMTKDCTAITNGLSAMHEAQRHVKEYPSRAADSGTPIRTAQHTLNRLLNNISGKTETSAEMASAALLGMPSTYASHDTFFCFIHHAIKFVASHRLTHQSESDVDADSDSGRDSGVRDFDIEDEDISAQSDFNSTFDADADFCDAFEDVDVDWDILDQSRAASAASDCNAQMTSSHANEDALYDVGGGNAAEESVRIYRSSDTDAVYAVPQYLHYQYRGVELESLTLFEWTAMIFVERIPAGEDLETRDRRLYDQSLCDDPLPNSDEDLTRLEQKDALKAPSITRSSAKVATNYQFDTNHPMYATHRQRVRATPVVPMLAGYAPPRYPGALPKRATKMRRVAWNHAAQTYAEYMLTLMVPWSSSVSSESKINGPPMDLTFANFCDQFREYRDSSDLIQQSRAECILQITRGLRVDYRTKKMLTIWRNRGVKRWGSLGAEAPPLISDGPMVRDSGMTVVEEQAADKAFAIIEELRVMARADDAFHALNERQRQLTLFKQQYQWLVESTFLSPLEAASVRNRRDRGIAVTDHEYSTDDSMTHSSTTAFVADLLTRIRSDNDSHAASACSADSFADIPIGDVDCAVVRPVAPNSSNGEHGPRIDVPSTFVPINLNEQQAVAFKQCTSWLAMDIAHDVDRSTTCAPPPLHLLIHGGAGVGKSTFAKALVEHSRIPTVAGEPPVSMIACAAPTGIAASLLIDGRTLHSLLGIRPWPKGGEGPSTSRIRVPPLDVVALTSAQNRLRGRRILLIDEVSMVGSFMLGIIDQRLRQITGKNDAFGGMGVVLMGDFYQLTAVGDTSLPTRVMELKNTSIAPDRGDQMTSLATSGGVLFRDFKLHCFTQQMRVRADDIVHTALVESFQQAQSSPMTPALLARMRDTMYLTHADVLEDPSWTEASIVVPTNAQRENMLPHLVVNFARLRGLPVLRFRYVLYAQCSIDDFESDATYRRFPALTGYFVQSAPVFISANINPNKGLANGTCAFMHSLSWEDDAYIHEVQERISRAQPGEIIDVDLPLSLNVEVKVTPLNNAQWSRPDDETLHAGRVVIPLDCASEAAVTLTSGAKMKYKQFMCELAFVITFHKCQGRTISKVILDLNRQPGQGNVQYSSLYVGLSRVRSGSDIRLFPALDQRAAGVMNQHPDALHHLTHLRPNADLGIWWSGFDELGHWSRERTDAAVHAKQRVRGSVLSRRRIRASRVTAAAVAYAAVADDIAVNSREIDATLDLLNDVDSEHMHLRSDVDDDAFDMLMDTADANTQPTSSIATSLASSKYIIDTASVATAAEFEQQCPMDIDSGTD